MRRGRAGRRFAGGGPLPTWLDLGPSFSYSAVAGVTSDPTTLAVSGWSDELDVANPAKRLVPLALGTEPTFVASGPWPTGAPGVAFNGVDEVLSVGRDLGMNTGPTTWLIAMVMRTVSTLAAPFCQGSSIDFGQARFRGDPAFQRQSDAAAYPGGGVAGVPLWRQAGYDGALLTVTDATGSAAAFSAPAASMDRVSVGARIASGAPVQFADCVIAWVFGYPRVLTPFEQGIAQAAAAARLGV